LKSNHIAKGLTLATLAASSTAVFAQVHNESGDAGSLPGTAQTVAAGTTTILGSIAQDGDSDMYRFTLTDASQFSVLVETGATDGLTDSQIFLFNLNGTGIAHNDDITNTAGGGNFMSHLPVGNALYNTLAPGDYLLAISGWDDDAKTGTSYIFPTSPGYTNNQGNIVGPTNAGAIDGWDGDAFGVSHGTYSITLTGVDVVPEPASMAALGLGVAALLRRRRK